MKSGLKLMETKRTRFRFRAVVYQIVTLVAATKVKKVLALIATTGNVAADFVENEVEESIEY